MSTYSFYLMIIAIATILHTHTEDMQSAKVC